MVGRLFIFKVVLKLLLPDGICAVLVASLLLALGIEFNEIYCKFANGLFDLFFFASKLFAAHFAESWMLFANKLLQVVHLVGGNIEHVSVAIFEDDIFLFKLAHFHYGGAFAKTYAMHTMHHIITRFWCDKLLFVRFDLFSPMFTDAL